MASVHIVLGMIRPGSRGGVSGLPDPTPLAVQTITGSESSQQGPAADIEGQSLVQPGFYFWRINASGGDVWLAFGANPVAAAGAGWVMLDIEEAWPAGKEAE